MTVFSCQISEINHKADQGRISTYNFIITAFDGVCRSADAVTTDSLVRPGSTVVESRAAEPRKLCDKIRRRLRLSSP